MTTTPVETKQIETSNPKSLTKADLLALLDKYPDDVEIRIIINEQDIRKAKLIRSIDAMPFEFELSKLCLESEDGLKINAWVHVSRLTALQEKSRMHEKVDSGEEDGKLIKENVLGWVKWFNVDKGMGFLQCDEILQDVFVYYKHLVGNYVNNPLVPNTEVEFSLYMTSRGPRAKNVQVVQYPDGLSDQYDPPYDSDM